MSNEQFLVSLEELIHTLSFKRIFLISLLVAFSLILHLAFENRNSIFTKVISKQTSDAISLNWELSDSSKEMLSNLNTFDPVVYVGLVDVDLKKNRQHFKWFTTNNESLDKNISLITSKTLPKPVFDYDTKNTQQMVAILNNEFNCVSSTETPISTWGSIVLQQMPVICRIAIPPYVGKFVGYMVIGVSRSISRNELDSLKMEATRIGIEIYVRDVAKNNKK